MQSVISEWFGMWVDLESMFEEKGIELKSFGIGLCMENNGGFGWVIYSRA